MPIERLSAALTGRYKIEKELDQGGLVTVYLATDLKSDRKVAVNVVTSELAGVVDAERFVREIRTTASLAHPHILPLLDAGVADGFMYYVQAHEGETLRERLKRVRDFSVDAAVEIATQVAEALDYAHRHGVVHGDIKTESILLHGGRVMVADFGLVQAVSVAAGERLPVTGFSVAMTMYMSPEQAAGDTKITGKSDIYSLASVLYEMLTGGTPHGGGSAEKIVANIMTKRAEPVTKFRTEVLAHVAAAIARALEIQPEDRFETAAAFASALTRAPSVLTASEKWLVALANLVPWASAFIPLPGNRSASGDGKGSTGSSGTLSKGAPDPGSHDSGGRKRLLQALAAAAVIPTAIAVGSVLYLEVYGFFKSRAPSGYTLDQQARFYEDVADSLRALPPESQFPVAVIRTTNTIRLERTRERLSKVNAERWRLDSIRIAAIVVPASIAAMAASTDSFQVPVFFAGMRKVAARPKDLDHYFENKSAGAAGTSHGVAHVWVPRTVRIGNSIAPSWCRARDIPHCDSTSQKRGVIARIKTDSLAAWRSSLDSTLTLNASPRSDVLIFVHGFNNSFPAAAERAAQIAYNIGFAGVVMVFDWPSAASKWRYGADAKMADSAAATFLGFLREVVARATVDRVIVIGHSMGTSVIAETLQKLPVDSFRLRQVVLGAPDIDSARFVDSLSARVRAAAERVTLYASSKDVALKGSKLIHKLKSRAGAGPDSYIIVDKIDYVDASVVNTDVFNHAYIQGSSAVMSDMYYLLIWDRPAEIRGIEHLGCPDKPHHRLPGSKSRTGAEPACVESKPPSSTARQAPPS